MGAVDYVFKPFNPDVLRMKVAVFVDLFIKQREVQRQAELLRNAEKRELELEHRTSLLEAEARSAAKLAQMNDELHRRQVALEQAMGARNRFYASMSHELRTPINAVIGYSTLMLDGIYGPLNAKQKEGLQRTLKAARHLLELVNDVLDLSKIEAGKIDLRLQPVSFPSLIEDLFVTVRPLADQYGSTLRIEHSGDPMRIVSDPRRAQARGRLSRATGRSVGGYAPRGHVKEFERAYGIRVCAQFGKDAHVHKLPRNVGV